MSTRFDTKSYGAVASRDAIRELADRCVTIDCLHSFRAGSSFATGTAAARWELTGSCAGASDE